MKVKIKKLHPDAVIPKYATNGASGFDLVAVEDVIVGPGQTRLIDTGLAFDVGTGFELQIRPRSGLSFKTYLRIANAPGTVDADFRGSVRVIMTNIFNGFNDPGRNFNEYIQKGDRIAQGVIQRVEQAEFEVVESLDETGRGDGAFGSTGK